MRTLGAGHPGCRDRNSKSLQLTAHRPNIDCFPADRKSAWQQATHAKSEFFKEPNSALTSERDLDLELLQVIGSIEQYFSEEMAANLSPPISFPDVEVSIFSHNVGASPLYTELPMRSRPRVPRTMPRTSRSVPIPLLFLQADEIAPRYSPPENKRNALPRLRSARPGSSAHLRLGSVPR